MKPFFDVLGQPYLPAFILATRNGKKIGQLTVFDVKIRDSLRDDPPEIMFRTYKYLNGELNPFWDKVKDFRLIWLKEYDTWFQITVEIDEDDNTIKTVNGIRLGEAELAQIRLYNVEINTENDILRDDYTIPSVLFNPKNTEVSILHRIIEKAPHYHISHVDKSLQNIQRSFSFDNISIYDAMKQIENEIDCIFILSSKSDENGGVDRGIYVYDIESSCNKCGHRETNLTVCPNCGSTHVNKGYGKDTEIFITQDVLGNNIRLTSDASSVRNCFKLVAGDDLMTATVRNCNPNGSDYIYYITDDDREDMSPVLASKLKSYDASCDFYQNKTYNLNPALIGNYNTLVNKYRGYNSDLKYLQMKTATFPALIESYYGAIDFETYLRLSMMPTIKREDTTALEQAICLINSDLFGVGINVSNILNLTQSEIESYALETAKNIVDTRYTVKIDITNNIEGDNVEDTVTWNGAFRIINNSDASDMITTASISIKFGDVERYTESYIKRNIDKVMLLNQSDGGDIRYLNKLGTSDFKLEIKKYNITSLKQFYEAYKSCVDIISQHIKEPPVNLFDKSQATVGYYLSGTDAHLVENANYFCSGFIPTNGQSSLFILDLLDTQAVYCYDENKDLYPISWNNNRPYASWGDFQENGFPTGTAYIRFNSGNASTKLNTIQIYYSESDYQEVIVAEDIEEMYLEYIKRYTLIEKEIDIRQNEINIIYGVYDEDELISAGVQTILEDEISKVQDRLNIENFLGEDLWQEFCVFRREDKYQNDNYISEGLSNADIIRFAMEFLETARKELYKTAMLRHYISAKLKDLFNNKDFKELLDKFEVGNWIRFRCDGKILRLRLLSYELDFNNLEDISVEFSDVFKVGEEVKQREFIQKVEVAMATYNKVKRNAMNKGG